MGVTIIEVADLGNNEATKDCNIVYSNRTVKHAVPQQELVNLILLITSL